MVESTPRLGSSANRRRLTWHSLSLFALTSLPTVACDAGSASEPENCVPPNLRKDWKDEFEPLTPGEVAERLGRGVNFGNMFDAPGEGAWHVHYDERYAAMLEEVGFSHIRLPVRFSNHATLDAKAELEPRFACRIDGVIDTALAAGLSVVMDVHHYRQLDGDPLDPGESPVDASVVEERLVNIWRQLAERYRGYPNRLVFELYNEPHNTLTVARWAGLYPRVIEAIRASEPERTLMLGGYEWASAYALTTLELPDDPNVMATFHQYDPIEFTFQGSTFPNSEAWVGTTCCDDAQRNAITRGFDTAKAFADENGIPVYLGEWGSSLAADLSSRAEYARFVRDEAEARGFPWAVWSLVDFGIYDPHQGAFIPEMTEALVGP